MAKDGTDNDPEHESGQDAPETDEVEETQSDTGTAETEEDDAAEDDEPIADPVVPPQVSHRGRSVLWILLFLIVVFGAIYWWLVLRQPAKTATPNATTKVQKQQPVNSYTPDTVAYAYKSDNSVYQLLWRPAAGGDSKTATLKLAASEMISNADVSGSNVVFSTDKAIYVSTDSGKSYKTLVKLDGTEQITGLKIGSDGSTVAYADLPTVGGKNNVKAIGLDGSGSKTLFTSDKSGVKIYGYSPARQRIIYAEGCWDCDGFNIQPVMRNLQTTKTTDLVASADGVGINDLAVNGDVTQLVYATSSINTSAEPQAVGTFFGAPYTINTVDLASNTVTQITTIGESGEKNPNGTLKTRQVHVGFIGGTNSLYYTDDTKLFIVSADKTSLTYEAPKPLWTIPYVGNEAVIAGYGTQPSDYTLVNYAIANKQSTTIFSGDSNTMLLGVTTK